MSVSAFPYAVFVSRGPEVITLSGTTGSPISYTDVGEDPGNASVTWIFETDGEVQVLRLIESDFQYATGVQWSDWQPTPGQDYWIRATNNAGSNPTGGSGLGTWLKVAGSGSSNRSWVWFRATVGTTTGSIKVEIATDSGGTDIVATGYYEGAAQVFPGG